MRTSKTRLFAKMVVFAAGALTVLGCGTYGDPCLRSTDCESGLVCWEGKCVVGSSDTPADAAPAVDGIVSGDGTASDGTSGDAADASTDTTSEEGSAPSSDSTGPDAMRDVSSDGDAVVSAADRTNDTVDSGQSNGDADARVSADTGSPGSDASGGDVGVDANVDARDALTPADAIDPAG